MTSYDPIGSNEHTMKQGEFTLVGHLVVIAVIRILISQCVAGTPVHPWNRRIS